ncbi:MAG: type I restriction enzyme, S subunit [Candidatus Argoarchaeum ethanivorans]|uniref:Type I restriction enzyme, S subunit n=1 Tax=Candidatus Argoarchaeum ethanivorans TaxID=2608793 RepID=A0A8B3S4F6_9EURY|nr:MAG: type I restriction enzyme, S subunit [Candidatus Argoarchaeum ethanivorans]
MEVKVKPGYEQTDVGMIPEDWGLICYADYLNIISGIGFKKSEYCDIGIRLLRIDNVSYGQISWDSIAYLPFQYTKKFPNLVLLEGDILLALNRPITNNQLKLARMNAEDSPAILYQRVGKIEVINRKLNKKFAYFVLRKYVRKFVEESSVGSDQPFVSTTKLKKICIPLPPLPEQTTIATALSDADALIQSLERFIAKKRDIKQGAMQELLTGKKRLPGFEEMKGYKKTEVGVIPVDWEVKPLSHLVYFTNGKAHESSIKDDGKYVVVNSKFISSEGKVIKHTDNCFCSTDSGNILMVMSDVPNGKAIAKCFFVDTDNYYTVNQRICSLKAKVDDPKLLFFLIDRNKYYLSFDDGVNQTNLRKDDVLVCPIPHPPTIAEQTAIATALSDMDAEIAALDSKLAKARQIKEGMMQELLTGRIRLT